MSCVLIIHIRGLFTTKGSHPRFCSGTCEATHHATPVRPFSMTRKVEMWSRCPKTSRRARLRGSHASFVSPRATRAHAHAQRRPLDAVRMFTTLTHPTCVQRTRAAHGARGTASEHIRIGLVTLLEVDRSHLVTTS